MSRNAVQANDSPEREGISRERNSGQPISEYYGAIKSGKIITSKKAAKLYKYLDALVTGKIKTDYVYDSDRACNLFY